MKKFILFLFCLTILISCDYFPSYKESELKEEEAEIISMTYVPSSSSTNISPGISTGSGDLVIGISTATFPEVWAVTFRCKDHNKTFALQGKTLFEHSRIGEIVILKYVDEIRYYKNHSYSDEILDQHTKQIIFKTGEVTR